MLTRPRDALRALSPVPDRDVEGSPPPGEIREVTIPALPTSEDTRPGRFYAENIGCAPAQVDLDVNVARLLAMGMEPTDDPLSADVVLVQTCSFLRSQAAHSVSRVQSLTDAVGERGIVLALGCAIDTERPRFEEIRRKHRHLVVLGAREELAGGQPLSAIGTRMRAPEAIRISRGCASACSFCSIRFSQGWVNSRSLEEIASAARAASDAGHTVCNLYSEDVGSYGLDAGTTLPELLKALRREVPGVTFRLSSMSPLWFRRYQDELLALLDEGVVDKTLYCPAQSGSSRMLKVMRRGYGVDVVHEVYSAITSKILGVRLYTDFLVGHPGETEEDVEATMALSSAYPYEAVSVWAFEEREGTSAMQMTATVPEGERASRARRVAQSYLRAHWRRLGLSAREGARRLLRGELPVRSNVRLFDIQVPAKAAMEDRHAG